MDVETSKVQVHSKRREPLTQRRSVTHPRRPESSITPMGKPPKLVCLQLLTFTNILFIFRNDHGLFPDKVQLFIIHSHKYTQHIARNHLKAQLSQQGRKRVLNYSL